MFGPLCFYCMGYRSNYNTVQWPEASGSQLYDVKWISETWRYRSLEKVVFTRFTLHGNTAFMGLSCLVALKI